MTPARTGADSAPSAHTSRHRARNFLMLISPKLMDVAVDERVPAVTLDDTPRPEDDLVLFRSLAEANEYGRLTDLCLERLSNARDAATSLRWNKDLSIVEALQGRFSAALHLLTGSNYLASKVTGPLRGRYENEFGLVLVEFGRPLLAIDRFDLALEHHRGDALACGQVWNNKAVALDVLGEPSKALRCVASSIELLTPTGDIISIEETKRTGMRILGR
jgi:hypothetical protein